MKNKATLVLIEQIVMLLVFALAAAICMRVFAASNEMSRAYEATDRAVLAAQNAAELIKADGIKGFADRTGAVQSEETVWVIGYDRAWNRKAAASADFVAEVAYTEEEAGFLFRAEIVIRTKDGTELFRLPVAGQTETEVATDETY